MSSSLFAGETSNVDDVLRRGVAPKKLLPNAPKPEPTPEPEPTPVEQPVEKVEQPEAPQVIEQPKEAGPETPVAEEDVFKPETYSTGRVKWDQMRFSSDTVGIREFPEDLVQALKALLKTSDKIPDEAVDSVSTSRLVTAFVAAHLDGHLAGADDQTKALISVFRSMDDVIRRLDQLARLVVGNQTMLRGMQTSVRDINATSQVIEMSQGYLLAESTGTLSTSGVGPNNINITQPAAVTALENARKQTNDLAKRAKYREGRPRR